MSRMFQLLKTKECRKMMPESEKKNQNAAESRFFATYIELKSKTFNKLYRKN